MLQLARLSGDAACGQVQDGIGRGTGGEPACDAARVDEKDPIPTLDERVVRVTEEDHVTPKVSLTIAGGRITSMSLLNPVAGDGAGLVKRIVAAQSLDVDGITGATVSTKTVLAAVSSALKQ